MGSNPRLAALSFSSIKLNGLLSRLFGSQQLQKQQQQQSHGSGNDLQNQVQSESLPRNAVEFTQDPIDPTHDDSNKKSNCTLSYHPTKGSVPRHGGILSNLLKMQALSSPPPASGRHRRRRRSRRQSSRHQAVGRPTRKQNLRKSSLGSELVPTSSPTSQILRMNRSTSAISLPGLIMTAPSGVGLASRSVPVSRSGAGVGVGSSDHGPRGNRRDKLSIERTLSSPVVPTASSIASANSIDGTSLYITSSPSVLAAATSLLGLQSGATSSTVAPTTATATSATAIPRPRRQERKDSTQYLQTTRQGLHSTRSSVSVDDNTSMYSTISVNPQVKALRLQQQAELAEVVADIMLHQDLLIRLCKSLIRYGAPSHRIELAMEAMCKTFGIDGSFAFLPGLMMISFGDSDTHTSETHLIKCAQGFDMGRLAKVNSIARAVVYGDLEPGAALLELKLINNENPPYSIWVMLSSYALSSGLIAPLVFKGSWYDMLAGMGLGSVVGLTSLLASRYSVYSNVFEVSTSIVVAFVAKALRDYVCFTGVVLSGIVMLLPGLSLTTAIMELSSRYMISGSVRMFYSLIYCLFLGFGLSIGSNLWDVFREPPPGDLKMGYCHPATEPWRWILFPILAIAFNIQLYAVPKQWPMMIVCSSVGYAVSEFAALYWPHSLHIAAAVSAFVVGLLGNIYERLTHELGAILLIVPGGMGVRSSLLLLDQSGNAAQGSAFALQMIVVALSIAIGLFAATLIIYPRAILTIAFLIMIITLSSRKEEERVVDVLEGVESIPPVKLMEILIKSKK
ncbi:hypothetical protein FBU30_004429 [Linnemannia zychae]|nr:hypothetical protein FBU30_004429 [Linnemannia zychae]